MARGDGSEWEDQACEEAPWGAELQGHEEELRSTPSEDSAP